MIDTKLLRQKLIDMAMRGLLVEQRQEEGNASDLLEEIRAEKAALIKKGQIKKEKPLPEIKEEEKPFTIPDNWCWVRLGEIGSWAAGATPSRGFADYYKGNIPWLKTGDLNDGYIYTVPEFISNLALQDCSLKLNPAGSILIAMYGATIGKLGILRVPMTTNQACCACIPFNGLFNLYLFYCLMANKAKFISQGAGGAQPNISKEKILRFPIPLPPLAEQKRIVAALEASLKLVDTIAKDSADLDKALNFLRQKVLDMAMRGLLVEQRSEEGNASDLLEQIRAEKAALIKAGKIKKEKPLPEIKEEDKPFSIPANWCWVRLGEIGIVQTGKTPPTNDREFWRNDTPFITPGDMLNGSINYANRSVSFAGEKFSRTVSSGTVLQVCIGGSIGKISMVDRKVCFNQQINAVSSIICDSSYIYFAMQNELFISALKRKACGTATPIINLNIWQQLLIPLPPLAEQKRIVAKLEQINTLIETALN